MLFAKPVYVNHNIYICHLLGVETKATEEEEEEEDDITSVA
jgi:hypothetical protein